MKKPSGKNKSAVAKKRVVERATDLAIELYGPALRELEKH
jgi:hypothetical protein